MTFSGGLLEYWRNCETELRGRWTRLRLRGGGGLGCLDKYKLRLSSSIVVILKKWTAC